MIRNIERLDVPSPIIGFNDTDDELNLPPNVLVSVFNMEFDRGGVVTRPGYSDYVVSGMPASENVTGLVSYKKADANLKLVAATDTTWQVEGVTGVFSSIITGLTSGALWDFTTIVDFLIGTDAVNGIYKYTGSGNAKLLKVVQPTTVPSVVIGASGSLSGAYKYQYTYISSKGAETNGSGASAGITPSSQKVDLSNITVGDTDVAKRRIYRTEAGGSVYYLLDTINDNSTTTYTDDITDVNLGTDVIPFINMIPPALSKFPMVYKEFLFLVDPVYPDRLYHSHQSFPEIFYTTEGIGYYLKIGLNDGQYIIGLYALRDTFYVFKERSTWPILGSNPDDFRTTTEPVNKSIGLYHRSIAFLDAGAGDVMVGLGKDGFYSFDGYVYKNLGIQKKVGIDISAFIAGLDKDQLHRATGWHDVAKHQYRCFVRQAGVAYNNRELVWDYKQNAITVFDRAGNAITSWNGVTLFGSALGDSKIHSIGGNNDDGTAITYNAEWPWWNVGGNFDVNFEHLVVTATQNGDYSPTVTVYVDGSTTAKTLTLDGGVTWASVAWGTSGSTYFTKVPLRTTDTNGLNLRGRVFKMAYSHNVLNEISKIVSVDLYFQPTKDFKV